MYKETRERINHKRLVDERNNGLSVQFLIRISVGLQVSSVLLHSPGGHLEEARDGEEKSYA